MNYRDRCIKEKGKFCHRCGCKQGIHIHHIDGNRSNNKLTNLVPLCRKCHGKVHDGDADWPPTDYRSYEITLEEPIHRSIENMSAQLGEDVETVINGILKETNFEKLSETEPADIKARLGSETVSTSLGKIIYDIMSDNGWMRTSEIYDKYLSQVDDAKSRKTVRRRLNSMCTKGIAERRGKTNRREYRLSQ